MCLTLMLCNFTSAMSLNKETVYTVDDRTPAHLAVALAAALKAANGAGQPFEVGQLSYKLPDGISFSADDAVLSDIEGLASFPEGFRVHLMSRRESNVSHVMAELDRERLAVHVSSRTTDGLSTFFAVFAQSFGTKETISSLEELVSTLDARARSPRLEVHEHEPPNVERMPTRGKQSARPKILLFTALQEEREAFEQLLGLKTAFEDSVARGVRHGVEIELVSARKMGRVPAAVAISSHLATSPSRFQLIVVAGVAGGFEEAGLHAGAVVIATDIVDLATRKKFDADTEFRPQQYATDDIVERFAKSTAFDRAGWERTLVERDKWPPGRRPYIEYGQLASVDEVVSSNEWRRELRDAWPKLLGVEMESGGACAAAERFAHRVAVIRGISDLADPRKSDDHWRRLSMGAVVALFDALLSSGVIKPVA